MSIPETIGRYRVLRELGRGGMGVVFAARDESLGRDIAIKMLHRGAEPHERDRLRREARAAAAIAHAAICQLYEIGEAGGELFIAMELVDGESLADRIARGPVPPREAAAIAIATLDALEAVHSPGFVLRACKPSIAALDKIIHRALAKSPADRYASASAMLADLRALSSADWSSQSAPIVRAMTRLIVPPFRLLRPDADVDFLSYSLADAVTTSLSGLQSLVMRSTAAAAQHAGAAPDLKRLAAEADVARALFGSTLRAGA